MNTKNICGHLVWGVLMLGASEAQGQATVLGHLGGPGDHLGWNAATLQALDIRHDGNYAIDWYTNAIRRATLRPDATYTIGSYTGQVRDGALLLSPDVDGFISGGAPGPFSALHLAGVGVNWQEQTFRPWMRNGVTFSGNSDLGYLGQKCMLVGGIGTEISDRTDMVAHWSGDPSGEYGPDRFRFLFTGGYTTATSGWHSTEGLEAMRMTPIDSATVNVGIGDFYAGNLVDPPNINEPTERLDVLNGNVRIRQLPTTANATTLNQYMVVDASGVVHWRTLPTTTANCEWFRSGAGVVGPKYVLSGTGAFSSTSTCPDKGWLYGLSKSAPTFKLDIAHADADWAVGGGINVSYAPDNTSASEKYGIQATLTPTVNKGVGVVGNVWGPLNYGMGCKGAVYANQSGASLLNLYGLYGTVDVSQGSVSQASYGVYGKSVVSGGTSVGSNHGGFGTSEINASSVGSSFGLQGLSTVTAGTVNYSYGLYGKSSKTGGTISLYSYGAYANGGGGSNQNFGVFCAANNTGSNLNCSLYASYVGTTAQDWSGYFNGKVQIMGDLYHGGTLIFSDASLKTDVTELDNAAEILSNLHPRRYRYTDEARARISLSQGEQMGFIAQEVQEVVPQLVSSTVLAAVVDESGQETWPAQEVSAVTMLA